jgi:hypothetical protein
VASTSPTWLYNYSAGGFTTTAPAAAAPRRWARLFWVQGLDDNKQIKMTGAQKLKFIHEEAKAWLAAYAPFRNYPEGQAMQFELANTFIAHARALSKDLKTPASRTAAREAQKILGNLAELDGDYSKRAAAMNLELAFLQMGENKPVEKLKDFEECYLKAQFELKKINQVEAKLAKAKAGEAEALRAEHKKRMGAVIASFERGLELADAKTPAGNLNEARFYLTVANQQAGRHEAAVAQGEQLARLKIPSKRSAAAAAYALKSYDALVRADASDANRDRLRSFADFILREKAQAWASEPVVPLARYQMGVLAIRERDHARAVEELEKLPPDFGHYTFAQCQAALTALNAAKDAKADAEKSKWQDKALAILRRVAKLPANADPATAQMFFAAQLKHGELLYNAGAAHLGKSEFKEAAARLGEMQKFLADLRGQFAKAAEGIDERPREELQHGLDLLGKYALLGVADAEYRQGNYDRVVAKDLLGGVVAQVQELGKNSKQIQLRDFQITGSILGLALRAYVQKGDPKSAETALDLLQRLGGQEGQAADPTAVLRSLVGELQVQVRELRAKGDAARLKKTVDSFSEFFDKLTERPGKKLLDRNEILFLANCYATLEQHQKAARLYGMVPAPKADPGKAQDDAARQELEKQAQLYWLMQIYRGRELRKAGDLAEAKKVLDGVLAEPKAPAKILAEKELIHLLEDDKKYAEAINRWNEFIKNPQIQKRITQDNEVKKIYFEVYYHGTMCWYRYSQSEKVKGTEREKAALLRAADRIVKLESARNSEGWQIARPYFLELLRTEPVLNQAYLELKKKA